MQIRHSQLIFTFFSFRNLREISEQKYVQQLRFVDLQTEVKSEFESGTKSLPRNFDWVFRGYIIV